MFHRLFSRVFWQTLVCVACLACCTAFAAPVIPRVQGMWWGGPSESGWGLLVIQHGDRIFCALAVYDTIAHTTWIVVPSATWDSDRTSFSGTAIWPRSTDFTAYDAQAFQPGAPFGEVTVQLGPSGTATMTYQLDVYSGTKTIQPLSFGPDHRRTFGDLTDIWWGGPTQNGWGVALLQQGETLIAVWLTYFGPNHGEPAWFFMNGGSWRMPRPTWAALPRPFGSTWLGTTFSTTLIQAPDNGPYTITFSDKDHATIGYSVLGNTGELDLVRMPF